VLFLSFDALDGVGGIQRFNTRVIRALGEIQAEGGLSETVSLSLWDRAGVRSVGAVQHRGFGRRKAAFATGVAREVLRLRPEVVLWGHVLLLRLFPMVKLLAPRARHALFVHGVEVWGDPRYRRVPGPGYLGLDGDGGSHGPSVPDQRGSLRPPSERR